MTPLKLLALSQGATTETNNPDGIIKDVLTVGVVIKNFMRR